MVHSCGEVLFGRGHLYIYIYACANLGFEKDNTNYNLFNCTLLQFKYMLTCTYYKIFMNCLNMLFWKLRHSREVISKVTSAFL